MSRCAAPVPAAAPVFRRRALAAEAAAALLTARLMRLLPARLYLPAPAAPEPGSAAFPAPGAEIRRAVETAAARLPVGTACLERALAARWMLARRGWRAVLHLGLAREVGARAAPYAGRAAHAWLTLGDEVVIGGAGIERYVPVARFG